MLLTPPPTVIQVKMVSYLLSWAQAWFCWCSCWCRPTNGLRVAVPVHLWTVTFINPQTSGNRGGGRRVRLGVTVTRGVFLSHETPDHFWGSDMETSKYPVYPRYACTFASTWAVHVCEEHSPDLKRIQHEDVHIPGIFRDFTAWI